MLVIDYDLSVCTIDSLYKLHTMGLYLKISHLSGGE